MQEFGRWSLIGLQDDNWVRSARLQSSGPAVEFRAFRLVSKQSFSKLVKRCRSASSDACSKETDSNPGRFESKSLRSRRISLRRVSHDQSGLKSPPEGGDWGELRSARDSADDSSAQSLAESLPWLSPVESIVSQRPMHRIASEMLQSSVSVVLGAFASSRWGCGRGTGAPLTPVDVPGRGSGTMRQNLFPNLSRVCSTRWNRRFVERQCRTEFCKEWMH